MRLAPGCDVSFRVPPAPLSLREEICLLGLWRHISPEEADNPSPARGWLTKCNPQHSPERAYIQYQELGDAEIRELFSFTRAWSREHCDSAAIKKALCQMPPARLEKWFWRDCKGFTRHGSWMMIGNTSRSMSLKWKVRRLVRLSSQMLTLGILTTMETSQRVAPNPVIVECSGLGGGDLNLEQPWHVCIKTNKHKPQVYGPSLALVEETVKLSDKATVHFTGLGLTKSLQEFMVLHYYATDSAASWYALLQDWFPQVRWALPGQLRYLGSADLPHCAYRALSSAHSTSLLDWTNERIGHGRMRIVSLLRSPPHDVNVLVRGFSAGSFVGLWRLQATHARGVLGAIACPPKLLEMVPHELTWLHYRADQLCMWKPLEGHALARRTVVSGDWKLLNHFGSQEHNYCHWLDNIPPCGSHHAWKVMLLSPAMANPQKRDASALRLLSWLSFSFDDLTSALLGKHMKQLATEAESSSAILRIVQESKIGTTWRNLAEIRLGLIDQITVSNLTQPSAVVTQLTLQNVFDPALLPQACPFS